MSGGRPKENRVRIVAHVDELTAQRIGLLVDKADPKTNTVGKVIDRQLASLAPAHGSAMRLVIDSVWQDSSSNFGGGSWKLSLECGHVEWRKGSQGIPRKCLCRDCKLGRASQNAVKQLLASAAVLAQEKGTLNGKAST